VKSIFPKRESPIWVVSPRRPALGALARTHDAPAGPNVVRATGKVRKNNNADVAGHYRAAEVRVMRDRSGA